MTTPEEQIRQAAEKAKADSLAALNQGQTASKAAAEAAQANIKAQQAEAVDRLLADARTRGFTGGVDVLRAEQVGPADRRVQSVSQGTGARDQDYEWRKANLGELYGRIGALAPQLGAQFAADLAARGGGGRGGRGGGGGGGGGGYSYGGMPTTQQTDVSEQHTLNEDELYQETMDHERLLASLSALDPRARDFGMDAWRSSGYSLPEMGKAVARFGTTNINPIYKALGDRSDGNWYRRAQGAYARKAAIQQAIDDAVRHRTRVTSKTGDKWKWSDKTNTRGKAKGTGFPFRLEGRG